MNKKEELLNKTEELIKKANELKELVNEQDVILVPDEIKIREGNSNAGLGIINGNKELYYIFRIKDRVVWSCLTQFIKCKLTPCKYEDLEPGDVFYMSDFGESDFKDLISYGIKLNDGSYQVWNISNCINKDHTWKYYWKVEPINS